MVEEGPYEILLYAEIEILKKEIGSLKKNSESSDQILNSINRLTKIVESMLFLFESAAKGMQNESNGDSEKKMNRLLNQNETLAEGILTLVDMIKELKEDEDSFHKEERMKIPEQENNFPMPPPNFGIPKPMSSQNQHRQMQSPPPIQQPFTKNSTRQKQPLLKEFEIPPAMDRAPLPEQPPLPPNKESMRVMPTGSFKDLKLPKEKKGLFGFK